MLPDGSLDKQWNVNDKFLLEEIDYSALKNDFNIVLVEFTYIHETIYEKMKNYRIVHDC